MEANVYPMVPASGGFYAFLIPMVLLTVVLADTTYAARHTTFVVSGGALRIRGDLYGRSVPLASLRLDRARVVDLTADPDLKLSWRTNGVGMPGYKSGWFRLKNGDKALLFVTNQRRVLALPTTEGYTLLLSASDPEGLLRDLTR